MESFTYEKPGARIRAFEDRLELVTGTLLAKRTHTIPWHAVTGLSVEGFGGHQLIVTTAGQRYVLPVGIGAGAKLRDKLLPFMSPR